MAGSDGLLQRFALTLNVLISQLTKFLGHLRAVFRAVPFGLFFPLVPPEVRAHAEAELHQAAQAVHELLAPLLLEVEAVRALARERPQDPTDLRREDSPQHL